MLAIFPRPGSSAAEGRLLTPFDPGLVKTGIDISPRSAHARMRLTNRQGPRVDPDRLMGELAVKVRDLSLDDLASARGKKVGSVTPSIARIRDSHHALARLIAEGRKDVEISRITGYSPSRISILKNDPAFSNLIEYYKKNISDTFVTVHERFASLSRDAAEELQARLDETPEAFDNEELMELAKLTADRTGFGPKSTNVNINIGLSERLEAARKRIGGPPPLIEHQRVAPAPQASAGPEGLSPLEDGE